MSGIGRIGALGALASRRRMLQAGLPQILPAGIRVVGVGDSIVQNGQNNGAWTAYQTTGSNAMSSNDGTVGELNWLKVWRPNIVYENFFVSDLAGFRGQYGNFTNVSRGYYGDNMGQSGCQTDDSLDWMDEIFNLLPDVIVYSMGTNDLGAGSNTSFENVTVIDQMFIDRCRAALVPIILCGIRPRAVDGTFPWAQGDARWTTRAAINAWRASKDDNDLVYFCDIGKYTFDPASPAGTQVWLPNYAVTDRLHPATLGGYHGARALMETMDRVVGSGSPYVTWPAAGDNRLVRFIGQNNAYVAGTSGNTAGSVYYAGWQCTNLAASPPITVAGSLTTFPASANPNVAPHAGQPAQQLAFTVGSTGGADQTFTFTHSALVPPGTKHLWLKAAMPLALTASGQIKAMRMELQGRNGSTVQFIARCLSVPSGTDVIPNAAWDGVMQSNPFQVDPKWDRIVFNVVVVLANAGTDVPVITIGEPALRPVTDPRAVRKLRSAWNWQFRNGRLNRDYFAGGETGGLVAAEDGGGGPSANGMRIQSGASVRLNNYHALSLANPGPWIGMRLVYRCISDGTFPVAVLGVSGALNGAGTGVTGLTDAERFAPQDGIVLSQAAGRSHTVARHHQTVNGFTSGVPGTAVLAAGTYAQTVAAATIVSNQYSGGWVTAEVLFTDDTTVVTINNGAQTTYNHASRKIWPDFLWLGGGAAGDVTIQQVGMAYGDTLADVQARLRNAMT